MAGTELAVVERCIAEDRYINGCFLKLTCTSYPEQYDVFLGDEDGEQIGYLRLRHGYFRADYPNVMGYEVYGVDLDSGVRYGGRGEFDDYQRLHYLTEAVNALLTHHWKETPIDGECRVIEDTVEAISLDAPAIDDYREKLYRSMDAYNLADAKLVMALEKLPRTYTQSGQEVNEMKA